MTIVIFQKPWRLNIEDLEMMTMMTMVMAIGVDVWRHSNREYWRCQGSCQELEIARSNSATPRSLGTPQPTDLLLKCQRETKILSWK